MRRVLPLKTLLTIARRCLMPAAWEQFGLPGGRLILLRSDEEADADRGPTVYP